MRKGQSHLEKHFVYLLSLALLLLGISMVVASLVLPSGILSSLVETLGLAMLPAAIVAFILEYYLQRRWMDQLLQSLTRNVSIVSQELGIRRIYRDRDEWDKERVDLYESAKNIKYLSVAPNMKRGGEEMFDTVSRLMRKGVSFQFLICHPDQPFATQYYGADATDAVMSPMKAEIRESIDRLKAIQDRSADIQGKLEFRIYLNSPGCYLQIIDKSVFFQPYFYGNAGTNPFMIQIDNEGTQQKIMIEHFNAIWRNAMTSHDYFVQQSRNERK